MRNQFEIIGCEGTIATEIKSRHYFLFLISHFWRKCSAALTLAHCQHRASAPQHWHVIAQLAHYTVGYPVMLPFERSLPGWYALGGCLPNKPCGVEAQRLQSCCANVSRLPPIQNT